MIVPKVSELYLLSASYIIIFHALFVLSSASSQELALVESEIKTNRSDKILIRQKRQTYSMCPRGASKGSDNGRSYLLLYSPNTRSDVKISYGSKSWPKNEMSKLLDNGFNLTSPTLIYMHAFTQDARATWLLNVRRRFNEMFPTSKGVEPSFNLLFFDWSGFSRQQYSVSASWVPHLGQVLGQFMKQLFQSNSYNMSQMHLISYSLSTHIAGIAGRQMSAENSLGQITALDPTGVCFHQDNNSFAKRNSLRPTDANLVVAKHYDMNGLGAKRAIGHVDVFVNGGKNQPQASRSKRDAEIWQEDNDDDGMLVFQGASSHYRAAEHETQKQDKSCHEIAYLCRSYKAFLAGECADCGSKGNKCFHIDTLNEAQVPTNANQTSYRTKSKMYIRTASSSSFCVHHYQVVVQLKAGASSASKTLLTSGSVTLNFDSVLQVKPKHKADNDQYTALVLQRKRLKNVEAKVTDVNQLRKLMSSLDHVELNYMSHKSEEERARASSRFCPNSDGNLLVKC